MIAKKQFVNTFGSNREDFICNSIIHCRKRNNIDTYRTEHSSQSLRALTKVRKEDLFRSHGTCILFCSGPSIYEQMKSIKNDASLKVSPSALSKQGDEQGTDYLHGCANQL